MLNAFKSSCAAAHIRHRVWEAAQQRWTFARLLRCMILVFLVDEHIDEKSGANARHRDDLFEQEKSMTGKHVSKSHARAGCGKAR